MGHGVVQLAASSGYNVVALDVSQDACDAALGHIGSSLSKVSQKNKALETDEQKEAFVAETLARIKTTTDVADLSGADLILEAIAENEDIKVDFFKKLGEVAKDGAILATNTSSFSVATMAKASGRESHTIGLHYFNPVQIMQLVEVVCPDGVDEGVVKSAFQFVEKTKKVPIQCSDERGFIVNRLLIPYIMQAVDLVARGDATPEAVDTAMRLGAGHPMGPITLADYVGHDITLSAIKGWEKDYPDNPAFQIPGAVALLEDMVSKNALGRKTGQGFYKWQGNKVVKD